MGLTRIRLIPKYVNTVKSPIPASVIKAIGHQVEGSGKAVKTYPHKRSGAARSGSSQRNIFT